MSGRLRDFPGQAFLELLRPPSLAQTRLALFASYSADPIVLGGAVLQLGSRGRDDGKGNKSDFATAIEAMRDRVRFIVQRGRIHGGRKLPKIAAVLDQFVVEMPFREHESSWHPKLAIVCHEHRGGRRTWRLWVGSRNLTSSHDLDLGLAIDGEAKRRKGSRAIDGIDDLVAQLARHASLPGIDPADIAREVRSLRWIAPDGVEVAEIALWSPGQRPKAPLLHGDKRRLVVFSPFLCDAFVATLARVSAQSSERTLVTTLPAIRKLSLAGKAQLAGFKLLSLSAPAPEGDDQEVSVPVPETVDGASTEGVRGAHHQGLHAKLFAAIGGGKVDIVAGSANATDRAWSGRNAEAVARFTGGSPEIEGIEAIVGSAFPIQGELLQSLTETDGDIAEQRLEYLRWMLTDLPFDLRRDGTNFTLLCAPAPSIPTEAKLEVGLATTLLFPWTQGAIEVALGDVPLSLQTDLVQFRVSLGDLPPAVWLRRIAVSPSIDAARDSAAIGRLLSVAGLQTWLREMLEGDAGAGTENDWDGDEEPNRVGRHLSWKHDGLALEDVLSAWARDDLAKLRRVDRMLDRYVAAVLAHGEHLAKGDRIDLIALQMPPSLVSFDAALEVIKTEASFSALRIVALDQPTIVANLTSLRPVDRVAASLISWLGGGVQPANRSKIGMFDDAAPIWRFKERLGAMEDPEASRNATAGLFLIEVFPALALPSLGPAFCGRLLGPRYNPARRKTFTLAGWQAVIEVVRRFAEVEAVEGLGEWAKALVAIPVPKKADQDRLDAVLCALIGLIWRTAPREASIMIGDRISGYMVAPASAEVRARLKPAADKTGVPIDIGISGR